MAQDRAFRSEYAPMTGHCGAPVHASMDSAGRKALGWRHGGRASVVRVHHVAPDLPSLRELLELGNYWIYQFFFFFFTAYFS